MAPVPPDFETGEDSVEAGGVEGVGVAGAGVAGVGVGAAGVASDFGDSPLDSPPPPVLGSPAGEPLPDSPVPLAGPC